MKKTVIALCLSLFTFAAFAQIPSFGVKGGVNFATMISNDGAGNVTSGAITSFKAGAFVDLKFGSLSLQPGLYYTGEGLNYEQYFITPEPNGITTPISSRVKTRLYYLQLPVNLVFHIPVLIGNIYFGAGPYAAEGISGKTTYTNGSTSQKVTFGSGDNDVKPTQYGADAIIGFKLKGGYLIETSYDLGLSNDLPAAVNDGSRKSRVFSVSLGYVFL